jgi:hypothetical protein
VKGLIYQCTGIGKIYDLLPPKFDSYKHKRSTKNNGGNYQSNDGPIYQAFEVFQVAFHPRDINIKMQFPLFDGFYDSCESIGQVNPI